MKHQSLVRMLNWTFCLVFNFIILLIFISGCKKDEPTSSSGTFEERTEGVFPGVGAAKINIGDSFAQMRSIHGQPDNRNGYPTSDSTKYSTYWIIYSAKGIKVYLKDVSYPSGLKDSDTSEEIIVMAPYNVKTAKGIGIGSSTTEVTTAYGQPKITVISNRMWYDYYSLGISFEIQSSAVLTMGVYTPR